jgi:hypothetical protein
MYKHEPFWGFRITRCLWEAMLPQIRRRLTSQIPKTLAEMVYVHTKGGMINAT